MLDEAGRKLGSIRVAHWNTGGRCIPLIHAPLIGSVRPLVPAPDAIDAYLLAKTGRADFADLHRLTPDSEKVAELKGLTRDQDSLIQMQTRLVNQLKACLKAYYPIALDLFAKLQQRSALVFLQTYPTVEAAQAASVEQIRQILKAAGHTTAARVAPQIFEQLHQPSLRANAVTTRTRIAPGGGLDRPAPAPGGANRCL